MITTHAYSIHDGIPSMRDSFVMTLYDRMIDERLYRSVFFDRSMSDRFAFLALAKRESTLFFVETIQNTPAGFFWLDRAGMRAWHIHFCIFREHWGETATAMGHEAFRVARHLREAIGGIDVIVGIIPTWNRFARAYALRVGMQPTGTIPHYLYDGHDQTSVDAAVYAYTLKEE
ncbi:hypothetical protein [Desulfovibrio inopinatus]|uniref:hypothetical protein n=1 Tax=Desulfovibrio inopinatus TaxID=102109 RepID=UPI0004100519|nr:hypothetical protein [Desulfovibrio inopinatus]